MNDIITYAVKLIFAVAAALAARYAIPWLKNKGLYEMVKHFVRAAEKLAQNCELDKKEYVVECLKRIGVKVTPVVDALIEAAVEELDIAIGKAGKEKASAEDADGGYGMTD